MVIKQFTQKTKKLFLIKNKYNLAEHTEGFTIIESLMAIMIITIIISFISPLMLLSVATRVQNRRVEQAMDIAQSEIDRIQVLMAQGVSVATEVNLPPGTMNGANITNVSQVAAPSTIPVATVFTNPNQTGYPPTDANQLRKIDMDGDGKTDFLVQIFRDQGARFGQGIAGSQLGIFRMGVRVYASSAEENLGNLQTKMASVSFASGLAQQRTNPLAVFYSEVSRSDLDISLETYQDYLEVVNP
jgi:type II secretory pathway pseudopilin PulG